MIEQWGWCIRWRGMPVEKGGNMKDPVKLLLGDEKSQAKTGGSATFKSGNWELSCWSTVQLTCGQTEKEVKKALEEATTLAFDHLDEIKGHLEEAMRRNLA